VRHFSHHAAWVAFSVPQFLQTRFPSMVIGCRELGADFYFEVVGSRELETHHFFEN
jgi:hypothetical protein